jgi:hypothetical protein
MDRSYPSTVENATKQPPARDPTQPVTGKNAQR